MKSRFLRPEDIRRLESFAFAPKVLAEGYLAGKHQSRRQGSSTEFRDHRPYSPGDDIRDLDWRVLARTDRPYLRTFEVETNTDCHIFLDCSASMGYGEKVRKLDYASFFVAALCYLVVKNRDMVSLQLFDEDIRAFFPPGSTHRHLQRILTTLEKNEPGQQTRLAHSLQRAAPLLRRRGTLIILSDFLDRPGEIFEALNPYLHQGNRIHLLHLMDREEMSLPNDGTVAFVDLETRERLVTHTSEVLEGYRQGVEAHIESLRHLAARRGITYRLAQTHQPFWDLFDGLIA